MHHIPEVDADLELDAPAGGHVVIALAQRALDFNAALRGLERAVKLNEERVADRFDFRAVETREQRSQQGAMLLKQLLRKVLVALGKRAVAHHVREHDGGEFALLGVVSGHGRIRPDRRRKETAKL